jgi:hypothetical protein
VAEDSSRAQHPPRARKGAWFAGSRFSRDSVLLPVVQVRLRAVRRSDAPAINGGDLILPALRAWAFPVVRVWVQDYLRRRRPASRQGVRVLQHDVPGSVIPRVPKKGP